MIVAFCPAADPTPTRDRVDHAAYAALRAIGELTTLVNFTDDPEIALLIHERANELRPSILALEDIAITRADRITTRS